MINRKKISETEEEIRRVEERIKKLKMENNEAKLKTGLGGIGYGKIATSSSAYGSHYTYGK